MARKSITPVELGKKKIATVTSLARKVVDAVKAIPEVVALVDVTAVETPLVKMETAMVAQTKYNQTERLQVADEVRDIILSAINHLFKAFATHVSDDQSDAKELFGVWKSFGLRKMQTAAYNDETALIRSMIDRFNTSPNLEKMAKFPMLSDWLTELEEANEAFDTIINEKVAEIDSNYVCCTELRNELLPAYREMIDRINAHALLETNQQVLDLVDEINAIQETLHLD